MGVSILRPCKTAIQSTLRRLGYELRRYRHGGSDAHESVQPYATYAPWNRDAAFRSVYQMIQPNTLVDLYRCYELWCLLPQCLHPGSCVVEVGVWRGGTGALLAKRAQQSGLNLPIYLCDTFRGVVKASSRDTEYRGGEHADTSPELVEDLVRRLGLDAGNVNILHGIFPEETSHQIRSNSVCFCHIDVDVWQSAHDVLEWVWPRLRTGGMVVFDDYGFFGCDGITALVEETASRSDRLTLHNLNGHAIVIKTANTHLPAPHISADALSVSEGIRIRQRHEHPAVKRVESIS